MSTVYSEPLTALKLLAVPFVIVRSPLTNPVTDSLNVIVTGIGDTFVASSVLVESPTVGALVSMIMALTVLI